VVKPRAAFRLGNRHAGQSQLGGFAKRLVREMPRLIKLFRQRLHFALGEFANALLEQLLLLGELEVQ